MTFIKVNAHGKIIAVVQAQAGTDDAYPDHLKVSPPDGATHYINGQFLTQPPRPSLSHYWEDASFSWMLDLASAKTYAKERITKARNDDELNGFDAYGKTFDSDSDSQRRILIAANTAQTIGASFSVDWTCKDNSVITLSYEQMVGMPVIMAQVGNELHQKARTLKAEIDAATTLEEINAVVW